MGNKKEKTSRNGDAKYGGSGQYQPGDDVVGNGFLLPESNSLPLLLRTSRLGVGLLVLVCLIYRLRYRYSA